MKMKTGNVWSNISFHCNVCTFPELHFSGELICLNENEKWCLIYFVVDTVRKIALAEVSWPTLSSTLLFAELPDLRRSEELPRMQVRNLRTWYLETHADLTLSHQTICLIFSVLRPRWNCRQQQVWGKKVPGDIFFQVISVEKLLMFHRTNRCLGCIG